MDNGESITVIYTHFTESFWKQISIQPTNELKHISSLIWYNSV